MRSGRMIPNPHAIMQAGNLFVYTVNNPIRWIDPSGLEIVLAGMEEQQIVMLSYLQMLTDHQLDFNRDTGSVFITSHATSHVHSYNTLTYGNILIERLITSSHVVTVNLTTGRNARNTFDARVCRQ